MFFIFIFLNAIASVFDSPRMYFWMNKDLSGIWTRNLWIDVPGLYQLSELARYWRFPYFVNIFVRGGASQKSFNHYTAL